MKTLSITPAALLVALAGTALGQSTEPFPAQFELSSLLPVNGGDGSTGFVLNGIDAGDISGRSVSSAGDVNGDGIDDIIIGASGADPNENSGAGESYVIFGAVGIGSGGVIELSSLTGASGFVINGIDAYDSSGTSVSSAGDVNGDGIDDLIIGANRADPNGISLAGESYVVFGAVGVGAGGVIELSSLNGADGFVMNGIDADDNLGKSVSSVGDINGDGIDDLIVGAYRAGPNGNLLAGKSYVVFGAVGLGTGGMVQLTSLDGTNGFVLNGIDGSDFSGKSVSSAGDVNGDGIDDLVIGASNAWPNGRIKAGESYVIFGAAGVGAGGVIELASLDGMNGFVLNGIDVSDDSGHSVSSAGDVNGDGIDDLVIGARRADPHGDSFAGESYLVFGGESLGSGGVIELSSLNGTNGFVLNGINEDDRSGISVSSARDLNGDGIEDLIIGAYDANPSGRTQAGESYVVFGASGVGSSGAIELSSLNGMNGFVLNGINVGDRSGYSVSCVGDVNGDGVDDLIIGARGANRDLSNLDNGQSYVVFGRVVGSIWNNPLGGDFGLGSNWENGAAPGAGDIAFIDNTITGAPSSSFALILPASQTIQALKARTDDVTINLNGQIFSLAAGPSLVLPGLTVGELPDQDARLRIFNSQLLQRFVFTNDVVVGANPTDPLIMPLARLSVDGAASGLDVVGQLVVGRRAESSQFWTINGADVMISGELRIASEPGSGGELRIDQAGSTVLMGSLAQRVVIGEWGDSSVEITSGGGFETAAFLAQTTIAAGAGSSGSVLIDGVGSRWITGQSNLFIGDAGAAQLELRNGALLRTDTTNQLVLARQAGSSAEIIISGAGSSWTELTQSIAIAGEGSASVRLEDGASLASFVGINVGGLGSINGTGTINASSVTNFGEMDPGELGVAGDLTVNGAFRQIAPAPGGGSDASGTLVIDVIDVGQNDRLVVNGSVELAGGARVKFDPAFVPDPDTLGQIEFISAASNPTNSRFDVALMPGLPKVGDGTGRFLRVQYPVAAGASADRGGISVSLVVDTLTGEIVVDPDRNFSVAGGPTAAAAGDLGSEPVGGAFGGPPDGLIDLAVTVPDDLDPTGSPGSVIILYNRGVDGTGNWLGFGETVQLNVGSDPSAIAIATLDDDSWGDLLVTNRADGTITALINDGESYTLGGLLTTSFNVGTSPSSVVVCELDGNSGLDAAVANEGDDTVSILTNAGGSAELWNGLTLNSTESVGDKPQSIATINADDDKWDDLITANFNDDTVSLLHNAGGAIFDPQLTLAVGAGSTEVIACDLDLDGDAEILTANETDSSISIITNETDGGGLVALAPSVELPVSGGPISLTAVDLDGDGDDDLAVVADDGSGTNNVVKVLRNDQTIASGLIFAPDDNLPSGPDPRFVLDADVDNANGSDVLTINAGLTAAAALSLPSLSDESQGDVESAFASTAMLTNTVTVVTQSAPVPVICLGDANMDGVVDFDDINAVLGNWLIDYTPGTGPGDADASGVVNFGDLNAVLGNWLAVCQ